MRADGSDKSVPGHVRNGFLGDVRVANRESIGRLIETVSNCFRSPICHIPGQLWSGQILTLFVRDFPKRVSLRICLSIVHIKHFR